MHHSFPKSLMHLLSNRITRYSNFTHSEHYGDRFNLNQRHVPISPKGVKACESDLLTQVEKAKEEYL